MLIILEKILSILIKNLSLVQLFSRSKFFTKTLSFSVYKREVYNHSKYMFYYTYIVNVYVNLHSYTGLKINCFFHFQLLAFLTHNFLPKYTNENKLDVLNFRYQGSRADRAPDSGCHGNSFNLLMRVRVQDLRPKQDEAAASGVKF